ncbi:MAG: hypothetical protein QOJ19_3455 [Acidimicrobiia bacterium]|nr:hypothetical protein [Acidimicrobiia bacterium]
MTIRGVIAEGTGQLVLGEGGEIPDDGFQLVGVFVGVERLGPGVAAGTDSVVVRAASVREVVARV